MIERLRTIVTRVVIGSPKRTVQVILVIGMLLLVVYFMPPTSFQPWIVLGLGVIVLAQAALLRQICPPTPTSDHVPVGPGTAMENLQESLAELATRIHVTVDGLVRASDAISEVTAQQISGTTEQVEVINTTSSLLEDFLKLTDQVNNQAETMTQTAQQAADVSQNGQSAILHVIDSMDEIRTQVAVIGETIVKLATLTHRIDEIITSVSEIATQSNLLALNASIEAARAGVHGRGFSVVANEVRSLSQQSTQAATQVRAILAEIQAAVKETIQAAEIGMQRVSAGVEVTQEVNDILVQITDDVKMSHEAVQTIYQAVRRQAEGMEEIAAVINRIDWITEQNMTSTVMGETVSTNLNRLASELKNAVEESQTLERSVIQHTQSGVSDNS